MRDTKTVEIWDEATGDYVNVELPAKYEVCSQCEGRGKSSLYLGAYTESEMAEAGQDFHDAYMAGEYDHTCETCKGQRVVQVIDREACERKSELKAALENYQEGCRIDAEIEAEHEAERRMGA